MEELFSVVFQEYPILVWLLIPGFIGIFQLTIWRITGSFTLSLIGSAGGLLSLAWLGLIPLWIPIIFGIISTGWLVFVGGLFMPNQLIQDQKKLSPATTDVAGDLLKGFESINFQRGIKALKNLNQEHSKLVSILSRSSSDSLVNTDRIKKLEIDIYNQGLHLLNEVLDTAKQLTAASLSNLMEENEKLERELESFKGDSSKATLVSIIRERLELNSKNLTIVKKYSDRIDELLCQSELCVDSIRGVCLTLPELVEHRPKDAFDKTLLELNTRIEFAQRVKAEYVKQGI